MKTTLDIHDELLARAKRHAKETGRSLRAVVENGLRRVLADAGQHHHYELPDLRVGDPNSPDPLATCSWSAWRDLIYGDAVATGHASGQVTTSAHVRPGKDPRPTPK